MKKLGLTFAGLAALALAACGNPGEDTREYTVKSSTSELSGSPTPASLVGHCSGGGYGGFRAITKGYENKAILFFGECALNAESDGSSKYRIQDGSVCNFTKPQGNTQIKLDQSYVTFNDDGSVELDLQGQLQQQQAGTTDTVPLKGKELLTPAG